MLRVSKRSIVYVALLTLLTLTSTNSHSADKAPASNSTLDKLESLVKLAETARDQEKKNDSKASSETLKQVAALAKDLSQGPAEEVNVLSLLSNASMEDGDDSPTDWSQGQEVPGVTYLWDREIAKSGKSSLCITKTENKFFPIAEWNQMIECESLHKAIKIKAMVKAHNASKAIVDVVFFDENSEPISHEWACYIGAKTAKDKPAKHEWKEYSGTVKIPRKTKKIAISLQMYGPGKVWFDDIKAEYVD